jgi:hypothetical protein
MVALAAQRRAITLAGVFAALLCLGSDLLLVQASRAAVPPAGNITGIYLDGSPGEPILAGRQLIVTAGNGGISAYPGTPPPATETVLFQFGLTAGGYGGIYLMAPTGQDLAVGPEENAVDRTQRDETHPGLTLYWVDGVSANCNASGGRFDVLQVLYDGDALVSFAADFETVCVGEWWQNPDHLFGEVRWQSSIPLKADRVDPVATSFPTRNTGTASPAATVTVTNVGTAPVVIAGVSLGGATPADFSITGDTCTPGSPIAAGASCTVGVRFTPATAGARQADLVIDDDTFRGSQAVRLSGTATVPIVDAGASPPELAFGSVTVGATSPGLTATLSNTGTLPLNVSAVTISGPDADSFSVSGETCTSGAVAVGASCQATVQFSSPTPGVKTGTLSFDDDSAAGTHDVALSATSVPPPSGIVWASAHLAGPSHTWNYGSSIGRTVQSGSPRIHVAYATDQIGGRWSTDSGPYAGIYYVRSTTGSTWTTPKRVNPSNQQATLSALASSVSRVYVVWESQTRLVHYSNTAPRVLYVRVNTSHGAPTAWRSIVRLSSTSGRASVPTIAAAGADVYIAWTNGDSGAIKLTVSHDYGVSWRTITLGVTKLHFADGYSGEPVVAASGPTVGVTWLMDNGAVATRLSTTRGATWEGATILGNGATGPASIAVRGSRAAVVWPTADDLIADMRAAGTWAAPIIVSHLTTGASSHPYAPAVAFQDPNRIAISWAEQRTTPHYVDLKWVESANGGLDWYQAQVIASASTSWSHRANDWPSVVWPSAGQRFVVWNAWTWNSYNYRLYFRSGSGVPVGQTTQAVAWRPATTGASPAATAVSPAARHERR